MSVTHGNSQPPQGPSFQPGYPQGAPGYGAAPLIVLPPPELAALPGASFGQTVRRFFHRYAQFGGAASVSEVMWALLMNILAALTPTIAVVVRRLHDTGKSGGWCLISLIPGGGLVLLILLLMPPRPELFQPEWV